MRQMIGSKFILLRMAMSECHHQLSETPKLVRKDVLVGASFGL